MKNKKKEKNQQQEQRLPCFFFVIFRFAGFLAFFLVAILITHR